MKSKLLMRFNLGTVMILLIVPIFSTIGSGDILQKKEIQLSAMKKKRADPLSHSGQNNLAPNSTTSMMNSGSSTRRQLANNERVVKQVPLSNYTVYYPLVSSNGTNNNGNNGAPNETLVIHDEIPSQRPRRITSVNGTVDASQYEKADVDRLYNDALLVYFKNFNEKLPTNREIVRQRDTNSTSSGAPVFRSQRRLRE